MYEKLNIQHSKLNTKKMTINRNKRKLIAEHTLELIETGFFIDYRGNKINIKEDVNQAKDFTKVYTPKESNQLIENRQSLHNQTSTVFEVTNETTLNAVRRLIGEGHLNPLYLNFASAKNAGGGFLGGSQAQEESIARATALYPCLLGAEEYYQENRRSKSAFYTDYMIYSPVVPIFKDEDGNLLNEVVKASVITAPAVNKGALKQKGINQLEAIEDIMKRRIEKVLAIALENRHDTIVLGAWGCGVFQNDPEDIASYFHEVIHSKFENVFSKIVFAVYASNERFIKPFQLLFQ